MHCAAARYIPPVRFIDDGVEFIDDEVGSPPPVPPALPVTPAHAAASPAPASGAAQASDVAQAPRAPWLTFAILALLGAVFAAELVFAVEPTRGLLEPGARTLLGLGGLQYVATVGSDEWYRMFLAPLMHTGLVHLLINGIALYIAGRILEPAIGARWFAALFVVSGLAGSFASLMINARTTVSVGASGAIMGLFAAMLVLSCRFAAPARGRLRITAIQVLVASMLPMAFASFGMVDYGAHLGGAIAGGLAAVLLLTLWPNGTPAGMAPAGMSPAGRPRLAFVALLIAAIGVAGAAYGATRVPHDHKLQRYAVLLFPRERLPATDEAAKGAAASLIATHPHDPRGHFYHALALIDAKNLTGAEDELRTALGDGELLRLMFKPAFSQRMEMLLSLVLLEQRKLTDAKLAAAPVCALANTFRDQVAKYGLCSL
jgi:membrane associated rhomboid family serine protease